MGTFTNGVLKRAKVTPPILRCPGTYLIQGIDPKGIQVDAPQDRYITLSDNPFPDPTVMSRNRHQLNLDEVIATFDSEFAPLRSKFAVHSIKLMEAASRAEPSINRPGVYVHWKPELGVIKVGKSQSNSKSRSLQHLADNTRTKDFQMKNLEGDETAMLVLFNIRLIEDIHWILSVEAYLDKALEPLIPSGRIG